MFNKISTDKVALIVLLINTFGLLLEFIVSKEVKEVSMVIIEMNIASLLIILAVKGK